MSNGNVNVDDKLTEELTNEELGNKLVNWYFQTVEARGIYANEASRRLRTPAETVTRETMNNRDDLQREIARLVPGLGAESRKKLANFTASKVNKALRLPDPQPVSTGEVSYDMAWQFYSYGMIAKQNHPNDMPDGGWKNRCYRLVDKYNEAVKASRPPVPFQPVSTEEGFFVTREDLALLWADAEAGLSMSESPVFGSLAASQPQQTAAETVPRGGFLRVVETVHQPVAPTVAELMRQVDNRICADADTPQPVSTGEHCPNCPDQGWFVGGHGDEPEQIQCEFCYTNPNSVFYLKNLASSPPVTSVVGVPSEEFAPVPWTTLGSSMWNEEDEYYRDSDHDCEVQVYVAKDIAHILTRQPDLGAVVEALEAEHRDYRAVLAGSGGIHFPENCPTCKALAAIKSGVPSKPPVDLGVVVEALEGLKYTPEMTLSRWTDEFIHQNFGCHEWVSKEAVEAVIASIRNGGV